MILDSPLLNKLLAIEETVLFSTVNFKFTQKPPANSPSVSSFQVNTDLRMLQQ